VARRITFIPLWRLREIRNIADSMVYRAALCPVGRLVIAAEKEYLRPNAHIRLLIDPTLPRGDAYHYIQILKNARYSSNPSEKADLIEVTICFNGDLRTKEIWKKTMRSTVKELGQIIFFSPAAKRILVSQDPEKLVSKFVNCVLKNHPFSFKSTTRPRLMLAHLLEIVKHDLSKETREILPHVRGLLMSFLWPDGW